MLNVVVTGGGTLAPIDDVRLIANVSSGRFSAEIAEAALRRGARVWHVHAPTALLPLRRAMAFDPDAPDPRAELDRLAQLRALWHGQKDRLHLCPLRDGTVADYAETLRAVLTDRPIDAIFLAMAVSDYEPEPFAGKLDSDAETLVVRCRRARKVILSVRDWAPGAYLVGFKLLSGAGPAALIAAAEDACRANRADLTVANDLRQLRAGQHTLHLVRPGSPPLTLGPDPGLADLLVGRVFAAVEERRRAAVP